MMACNFDCLMENRPEFHFSTRQNDCKQRAIVLLRGFCNFWAPKIGKANDVRFDCR